jgi:hypothetical protein
MVQTAPLAFTLARSITKPLIGPGSMSEFEVGACEFEKPVLEVAIRQALSASGERIASLSYGWPRPPLTRWSRWKMALIGRGVRIYLRKQL